jgi:hypothetical protein
MLLKILEGNLARDMVGRVKGRRYLEGGKELMGDGVHSRRRYIGASKDLTSHGRDPKVAQFAAEGLCHRWGILCEVEAS